MLSEGRLIWVSLSYATYGLVVKDHMIVAAPPIAAWMIGKSEIVVIRWLRGRNAQMIPVDSLVSD